MPSALVNRYAVHFRLEKEGKVRGVISRDASLFMAIESCLAAYEATGHQGFVIEDQRRDRIFRLDRNLLLRILFLKASNRSRYFEVFNGLETSGGQAELESLLADFAPI